MPISKYLAGLLSMRLIVNNGGLIVPYQGIPFCLWFGVGPEVGNKWDMMADSEPCKIFFEHISSTLGLLKSAGLRKSLHRDLWKARWEAESLYALSLSGIPDLV